MGDLWIQTFLALKLVPSWSAWVCGNVSVLVSERMKGRSCMLRDSLLYLAQNPRMKDFVTHNWIGRGAARRFVAGETLDEAIQATHTLNGRGMQVALDLLGENVT